MLECHGERHGFLAIAYQALEHEWIDGAKRQILAHLAQCFPSLQLSQLRVQVLLVHDPDQILLGHHALGDETDTLVGEARNGGLH